jgi:P-type Ca2+ transporter type 2C
MAPLRCLRPECDRASARSVRALSSLDAQTSPLLRAVRSIVGGWLPRHCWCVLVVMIYGASRGTIDWGGSLAAITLARGVMPEEFPLALTLFLALGGRHGSEL